jgi:hypothetical protein
VAGVDLLGTGTCSIAADQAGNPSYSAAPEATLSFSVGAAGTPPQTFTVTNLNNSGPGSLRAAIAAANAAAPGPNVVNFDPSLTGGTIVLTSGQIQISRAVTIDGGAAPNLAISGNANSRIFSIFVTSAACPGLEPGPDFLVQIKKLHLTNAGANFTDSFGGAIYSGHSLLIDRVTIDNSIARAGAGVGFDIQYPGQALAINGAVFMNNIATPTVPPVTFVNSVGGAVAISERCGTTPSTTPVSMTIESSVFGGNVAQPVTFSGRGGAIFVSSRADIAILDSRIVGNIALAPNPPVAGQVYQGGGIWVSGARSLRIERSEIAENSAVDVTGADVTRSGGVHLTNAISNLQRPGDATAVHIINSTVSGNSSSATAGAILAYGNVTLELDNATVSNNSAAPTRTGGIVISTGVTSPVSVSNATPPTLTLVSSILATNSSSGGDIATNTATIPTFSVNTFNSLIQNICPTCNIVAAGTGTFLGTDPMLGALAFNGVGAPTRTQALLPGSICINTGSNPLDLATDQRGTGFPRVNGGAPDMGAYESP